MFTEDAQCRLVGFLAETAPARVVEFVLRAAQDFSHATRPGEHDAHPEPIAWINHLIDTAEESGDGNLSAVIDGAMPEHTVCLREAAARATAARIATLRDARDCEQEIALLFNNLANRLSDVGRREEALDAAQQAVEMRRHLAAQNPEAYGPDLAMSLNTLAIQLGAVGKREEALDAALQAVAMRRQLAAQNPEAYRPNLATICGALCQVYRGLERRDEAADAAEEGLRTLSPLFERHPAAHARLVAALCEVYQDSAAKAGREPDGALLGPVVEKLEVLKREQGQ